MAGTFDISTINVISPNGLVTKAITASDTGYLNVPSPQFADAINLTSGQIKFPATQVPSADANTLDDYEEGTFTPYIFGSTSAGAGTYADQNGKYTKIGDFVYFTIYIYISAHTGTGQMKVGGLPFVSSIHTAAYLGYVDYITFSGQITAWILAGASQIAISQVSSNTGSGFVNIDTSGGFMLAGSYKTN